MSRQTRFIERVVGPSIAYVPLTRGQYCLIDADDISTVDGWNWCAVPHRSGFYALRTKSTGTNRGTSEFMHRVIGRIEPGFTCDHKNRNGLDNRRCNLRQATYAQNNHNKSMIATNTSGFKGVSWNRNKKKWNASIEYQNEGRRVSRNLGYFLDPARAHDAYVAASVELRGEFHRSA